MSTSNIGLTMPSLRSTVPVVSASLFALSIFGGLYNFSDPIEGAKMFGIAIPASESAGTKSSSAITATEKAYIKVHGIRNLVNGIGSLGVIAFLRYSSLCQNSPVATEAVRKSLGIMMVAGSLVALVDGLILKQFADEAGLSNDTVELASAKSQGHMFTALPILALGFGWLYT